VRARLDIAHLPDRAPLAEISGGEQARLTLARVLLGEPDLLILDEPTNHLDADGIAWLGEWLTGYRGGVLVVSHEEGRVLLADVDLAVRGGERILLSGRNGTGKTTLLRVLSGQRSPDAGAVTGVNTAHLLPQTHDHLRSSSTVLDFFRSRVPVYVDDAEELLDAYLFEPGTWDSPLRTLSAEELRRLLLAVLVNSGDQVLLLDEPTNYLDFDALDVIEEALRAYQGTLIMVTHDGYFADRVGVTRHLQVESWQPSPDYGGAAATRLR
jgi:ATPase subunit of ABC transporter with duplicated ATPase domains